MAVQAQTVGSTTIRACFIHQRRLLGELYSLNFKSIVVWVFYRPAKAEAYAAALASPRVAPTGSCALRQE